MPQNPNQTSKAINAVDSIAITLAGFIGGVFLGPFLLQWQAMLEDSLLNQSY